MSDLLIYSVKDDQVHIRSPHGKATLCGMSIKGTVWLSCMSSKVDCSRCGKLVIKPKWNSLLMDIMSNHIALDLSSKKKGKGKERLFDGHKRRKQFAEEKFQDIWPEAQQPA